MFLARASSFEEAFQKFLVLGHRREENDIDVHGFGTAVRFAKIVSLNMLGTQDLDGAVICAVVLPGDGTVVTVDSPLDPESSDPGPSI